MTKGKIARILSDTEIVMNVGARDHVGVGQEFVIYEESEPITDPETGEDLGRLERVKGRVKVTHVMERIAIAKTLNYETVVPLPFGDMSPLFELGARTETRPRKLAVAPSEVKPVREIGPVKVGDLVHSVS